MYMYYARGSDSLNFSALGDGNGVLIKSGYPYIDRLSPGKTLEVMRRLNPAKSSRPEHKLCNGQTLLCKSLNLKVVDWNQKPLDDKRIRLEDVGYTPTSYIQCRRLGIPAGRDEHLPYRFIDSDYAKHCTSNPLTKRSWLEGTDWVKIETHASARGTIRDSASTALGVNKQFQETDQS